MHPINKILSYFGVQLYKSSRQAGFPAEFRRRYNDDLKALLANPPSGFKIFSEIMYEKGIHPQNSVDAECSFVARHINRIRPESILDIGSYRHFIFGLLAHYSITTLDVRPRKTMLDTEKVVVGDAKNLPFKNESFNLVLSLCTLEHLGLGRYGDEIDFDADKKALREIARVLKSGGSFIFTTEITNTEPQIAFNSHKIYDHNVIQKLCAEANLFLIEEKYFSRSQNDYCSLAEVTSEPKKRDVYMGLWEK